MVSDCKVRIIDNNGTVVDLVGIGVANESEGDKTAKGMSNSKSIQRKDNDGSENGVTNGWDTDNNEDDFYSKEPTPRNSEYSVDIVELVSLKTDGSISIEVGENKVLSIVYEPENATEKRVKFESLNSEIVTVDNEGNIVGIKEGETTIEVTSTIKADIYSESIVNVNKATE